MKIVALTTKLNFRDCGGSIEETDLIFKSLQQLGHELKAVTTFSDLNNIPQPLSYELLCEQITSRRLLGIAWQSYKLLKKYEDCADVFHVDGQVFLYGAGLYRWLGGKIPVSTFFNRELTAWPENILAFFHVKKNSWFKRLKKQARWLIEKYIGMPVANTIDLLAFTSPTLQKEYDNFGLKTAGKSIIIGDPFDYKKIMAEYNITETTYRQRNKHNGPFVLFFSGRMVPGKGFDFILKAFSKLHDKKKFRLVLGGSGPEEIYLHQLAKDLAIEPYVKFTGWVSKDQIYKNLKQTDIFLHTCWRTELTSVMLLEAMTFGLPCILPGGGGIEWVAKNSALYFNASDYHDLTQKIEQLSRDSNIRDELSLRCYKRLAEDELNYKLNIAKLAEKMEKLLPVPKAL